MEKFEKVDALIAVYGDQLLVLAAGLLTVVLVYMLIALVGLRRQLRTQHGDQRAVVREIRDELGDEIAHSRQQVQESINAGLMRLQDLLDRRMAGR